MAHSHQESFGSARGIRAGSSASHEEPMDISASSSPASKDTPEYGSDARRQTPRSEATPRANAPFNGNPSTSAGHQQKYVQAAFVQKLYNMLDDSTNNHSIRWSDAADSFIVNPGPDFQNVLATYFKHTNPQSFVRQLNMYGFHKVNDVFQGNTPDTHLWEFKHGEGNFKRGDLSGLSEIKRRPSKPAVSHRETVSVPMHPPPGPPVTGPSSGPDHLDARLLWLEQQFYDTHVRLLRAEEVSAQMSIKCQMLADTLAKCQKTSRDMTSMFMGVVPDREHPLHRDAVNLQSEIDQQMAHLRSFDVQGNGAQIPLPRDRRASTASSHLEGSGTMSPFQGNILYEDSSRLSAARQNMFRHPHLARSGGLSPRRPLSLSQRIMTPPPPSNQDLSISQSSLPAMAAMSRQGLSAGNATANSYLARRHTSADIRDSAGWPHSYNSSDNLPLPIINRSGGSTASTNSASATAWQQPTSGNNSTAWPSSPQLRPRPSQNEQQIRESLGRYQIDSRNASTASDATITQGISQDPGQTNPFGAIPEGTMWGGGGVTGTPTPPRPLFNRDVWGAGPPGSGSGASTRRSSMAHLLNPADTAEVAEEEEEEVAPDEERKRKRVA